MKYAIEFELFFVELHVGIYNASAGLQRFDCGELWEMRIVKEE